MQFLKHTEVCVKIGRELAESLSDEEIDRLTSHASRIDYASWIAWRDHFEDDIAEFVALPPSRRGKKKFWQKGSTSYLFLVLAGYQHCMEAAQFLRLVYVQQLHSADSGRDLARKAGIAYRRTQDRDVDIWPYSGYPPFRGYQPRQT